jgi:hypothetical protein
VSTTYQFEHHASPRNTSPAGRGIDTGLAGWLAAREQLDFGSNSRVLVFGTEGATNPVVYRRLLEGEAASS